MDDIIIQIENLNKTFGEGENKVVALDGISLSVKRGEIFGIIGLSGAGKSTLVRCINYLEKPTSGKVIVEGRDLSTLTVKKLLLARRSMAMIFQSFNLLSQRNALQNVCYPMEIAGVPRMKAKARATELLELVGLGDKAKAYPSQMSGGQKQRVAIARALASNPSVLLCDEATSALDPNTTRQILDLLRSIHDKLNLTIVIITHEMKVIETVCDRVAVIDKSKIAEMGRVSDVFLNPQSDIAKELILPNAHVAQTPSGKKFRLVFNGEESSAPVLSELILECQVSVNILFADAKTLDGKNYGQMVIQIPDDDRITERVTTYLDSVGISYSQEG